MENLFLSAAAVAGTAVLWRNLLRDNPRLSANLKRYLPGVANKALQCGFCFTYWLSLAFCLVFDPLQSWTRFLRFGTPGPFQTAAINLFLSWMAIGIVASILRFTYAAIQEIVHHLVHTVNADPNHRH